MASLTCSSRAALRWALLALGVVLGSASAEEFAGVPGFEALDEQRPLPPLQAARGGAALNPAALHGRWVLMHLWATWCKPCRHELPQFDALATHLDPAQAQVLLVAIEGEEGATVVQDYVAKLGLSTPAYLATASHLDPDFWAWGVPVTYLLDRDGKLRGRWLGSRDWVGKFRLP